MIMATKFGTAGIERVARWRKPMMAGLVFAMLLAPLAAHAQGRDRSSAFHDIVVQQDETVDKIACFMCTVYVHGAVNGKVAVSLGNVVVDGTVRGKVAIFGGDLKVRNGGAVDADVAIAAGKVDTDSGGTVSGKVAQVSAAPMIFGIAVAMLVPILFLVAVIWFIVWLVQRSRVPRFPYPPPPRY